MRGREVEEVARKQRGCKKCKAEGEVEGEEKRREGKNTCGFALAKSRSCKVKS